MSSPLKILVPLVVANANITASNVALETAWTAGTYPLGTQRRVGERLFEVSAASTSQEPSDTATDWFDAGPANRFAAFDRQVGVDKFRVVETKTSNAGSITYNIQGLTRVGGVAMFGLQAASVSISALFDDPYSLTGASYDGLSFSVATQEPNPTDVFFKPDGLKMYIVGSSGLIYQYSLSVAWTISTASYDSVSFSIAAQETLPTAIFFKEDGLRLFVLGQSSDLIYQYTLGVAWDISTASYDSISFSVGSQEPNAQAMFFKPSGLELLVRGFENKVFQYNLTSAWNISTASYTGLSFDLGTEIERPRAVVYKYALTTSSNISTASYDGTELSILAQDSAPAGLFFKPAGLKFFVLGGATAAVYQYSMASIAANISKTLQDATDYEGSLWRWMFIPQSRERKFIDLQVNIPQGASIDITIANTGDIAKVGTIAFGLVSSFGVVGTGTSKTLKSRSFKKTEGTLTSLLRRTASSVVSYNTTLLNYEADAFWRLVQDIDGIGAVFSANDQYPEFTIYGTLSSANPTAVGVGFSKATIEAEEL
jgi:hypothetical protein